VSNEQGPSEFFAERPQSAPAQSIGVPAPSPAPVERWQSRIKGVHVAVAAFLVALVWVFWPQSRESRYTADSPPRVSVDPAATRFAGYIDAGRPPAGQRPRESTDAPFPETASAKVAEAVGQPANADIEALKAQVTALTAELNSARAEFKVCPPVSAPAPAAAPILNSSAPSKSKTRLSEQHAKAAPKETLLGFRLNTIYNGQAWVERDNRTYVVEPGSVIGTARVERIDAKSRVVETTQGDIR
jgi:type IV secretory pathway VirB10-like protein